MFVTKLLGQNGAPDLRVEGNDQNGITLKTEGPDGDARFMTINSGSNGYEITVLTHLTTRNGLHMEEDGYPTVFKG